MKNIIDAIITLLRRNNFTLTNSTLGNNRANSRGDALEIYIKNLFADTFECLETERLEKWNEIFSWSGNFMCIINSEKWARLENHEEIIKLQKD